MDPTLDDLFRERCERERLDAAGRVRVPNRRERRTKLVQGVDYVVAIEVEVEFPPDLKGEACYRPETIRRMEHVADLARGGDVAALEAEGTVYVRKGFMTASA